MRRSYEDFLRRLNQYRLYLNMTQQELSTALGITQSQFSKLELGKTIVSYKTLANLIGMGWDVDYLVTGQKSVRNASELNSLINQVENPYKKELLLAITWLLEQGISKCCQELDFETRCEIEILRMKAGSEEACSVLCKIRKISGIAQIPMAERLGVNIKKYRMLEKNKVDPDAELLFRIYEVTGCRPSLFLDYNNMENMIIDDLWNQISLPVQKKVLSLTEQVLWFIRM